MSSDKGKLHDRPETIVEVIDRRLIITQTCSSHEDQSLYFDVCDARELIRLIENAVSNPKAQTSN